jgi:hypothetical protein
MDVRKTRREIYANIRGEMLARGFRRGPESDTFVLSEVDGFIGQIGYSDRKVRGEDCLKMAPIISVRCERVENLIVEWCGKSVPGLDRDEFVPTISSNLGYLLPESGG